MPGTEPDAGELGVDVLLLAGALVLEAVGLADVEPALGQRVPAGLAVFLLPVALVLAVAEAFAVALLVAAPVAVGVAVGVAVPLAVVLALELVLPVAGLVLVPLLSGLLTEVAGGTLGVVGLPGFFGEDGEGLAEHEAAVAPLEPVEVAA